MARRPRIIGYRKNGSPIWLQQGASPDDPADGGTEETNGNKNDDEEDDAGKSDSDDTDDDDSSDDEADDPKVLKARIKELAQEARKHRKGKSSVQSELDAARAELRKVEDKDKSELELAKREVEELKARDKALTAELEQNKIERAFLLDNSFEWHDPEAVLLMLGRAEGVKIEDGEVVGVSAALRDLAKRKSYLVKATRGKRTEQDSGSNRDDDGDSGGTTGTGSKTGKPAGPSDAAIRNKYRIRR